MVNSNTKGDRGERSLVNWLADNGWVPIRVPSSGSATERDLPDIIAGNTAQFIAVEVKRAAEGPVYLDGHEVDALERFAEAFGATPFVGVKFDLSHDDPAYGEDYPGFHFIEPKHLYRTDGGNYRVKKTRARTYGTAEVDL